jgi:hypothetical protein
MAPKVPLSVRLLIVKSKDHAFKRKKRKMENMSHNYYNSYFFKLTKLIRWVFLLKDMYFWLEAKGLNDNGYFLTNQFD